MARGDVQLAQGDARQRVHAVELDGLGIGVLGFLKPARGLECLAECDPRWTHLRRDEDCGLGHLNGRFSLLAGQRDKTHADECLRMARIMGKKAHGTPRLLR